MLSVPVIAAAAPKAISGMEGKTIGYVAEAVDHQLPDTFSKLYFVQAVPETKGARGGYQIWIPVVDVFEKGDCGA